MAIRMRYGLESEFDPDKMVVGEWAVSTDMKYVRMCFAPGIVARMATYESFEADMVKVQELVSNAQSVKDIVIGLASEVSSKTTIVLEATEEAKKYMEEAKKYSELAFATTPDGYEVLVKDVDLLKNSIVQTTDRTLYGSKAGGIKLIGVKGASEQKQYSGKNLWAHGDVSGTQTTYVSTNIPKGTYTISTLITSADTEATSSRILFSGENGASIGFVYLVRDVRTSKTITFNEDVKGMSFWASESAAVSDGDTFTFADIQIEVGEVATDYEPYTGNAPSPSPSYPQDIESVGDSGSLVIEQSGKNLLNTDTLFTERFVQQIDGELKFYAGVSATDYIPVVEGETYFFSGMKTLNSGNLGAMYDRDKNFVKGLSHDSEVRPLVVPSGVAYIRLSLWHDYFEDIKKAQLEKGTTATEYEPYHSNTITIPLNEPLRGIGDIKDEVVCKDGVWGVERKISKVVYDGSESWALNFTTDIRLSVYRAFTDGKTPLFMRKVLCDKLISSPAGNKNDEENVYICSSNPNGNNFIIDLPIDVVPSLAEFFTWLSENPITVEYELATPVFEPFTDQSPFYQMKSYDTVTYISTDSKVEPSIEVKFGRTEGDAITLGNYNRTMLNEIRISELMALQTELATALVAGSEG